MLRKLVAGYSIALVFFTVPVTAAEFGTAEEAKAMLEKAVAAVSEDKAKALDMFNKGEGGFRDRDLYVFCANASDGTLTAHPTMKGEHLRAGVRQTRCSPSSIVWSTQFAVEMHTLRQLPE